MKKIRIQPDRERTYRIRVNVNPLADIPVLPDDLETLTPAWLIRWAEWVAAGKPEVESQETANTLYVLRANDWNPALHPRDPRTGKFVERSFNVPDDLPDFDSMGVKGTLEYLDEQGEDVAAILDPESGVTIDGVPNDATSLDDIPDGDSGIDVSNATEARDYLESKHDITAEIDGFSDESAIEMAEAFDEIASEYDVSGVSGIEADIDDRTPDAVAQFDRRPDSEDGDAILVNPDENREKIQKWHEDGQHISTDYSGIIKHELGHALTGDGTAEDRFDLWRDEAGESVLDDGSETYQKIEDEISGYADSAWPELVAEVFAGVKTGELSQDDISDDVLELYNQVGGPDLNNG